MNVQALAKNVYDKMPASIRDTAMVQLFGLTKIPLLFFCGPRVLKLTEEQCVVKIPLSYRTKNHLGSMYFGVLSCGADCAGGLIAMKQIMQSGKDISLVFKDFHADFLKRPMDDVIFTCTQGAEIADLIRKVVETGERQNLPLKIVATEPKQFGNDPVATFTLTLSLKLKK